MSNIDAINQAPGGIKRAAAATALIRQKPNPWFNVLAAVVIVAGIIYTGIHLADDLSVVRDTRAYPYIMGKAKSLNVSDADKSALEAYKKQLDHSTKFIPTWVKVAVAIALGLGTMIGWKRIVVTVGERIGKTHLTYAQGASAEIVAMATIGAAEMYGLPVSTTHVLSSGVAGTMVANQSGLQWATVRHLLMAWVLTLPASIALAGSLYWLLRHLL
jgi:phosphate/sulfate permease